MSASFLSRSGGPTSTSPPSVGVPPAGAAHDELARRNKAFSSLRASCTVYLPTGVYEAAMADLDTLERLLPIRQFLEQT